MKKAPSCFRVPGSKPGLSKLALALALALGLAASPSFAELARESRPVSAFDRVVLRSVGDLEITQGADEALVVEAEPRLMRQIKTEVKDGTLTIDTTGGQFRTQEPLRYLLRVKRLSAVEAAGSGTVQAGRLTADRLQLVLSGSGGLRIVALTAETLVVEVPGSGDIAIESGRVGRQEIRLDGSAQYTALRLLSRETKAEIGGSGDISVAAEKSLAATIHGSGRIAYRGDPTVTRKIDGAGSVEREGPL